MTSERTDLQAEHPSNVFPAALTTPTEPHGHAAPQRGVDVLPSSSFRSGRFGRMFRSVPVFELDDETPLVELGVSMTVDTDTVDSWESFEHPELPAGYTYLGQFIDHDITFDPISSLQRQNDPDALHNFRTPKFFSTRSMAEDHQTRRSSMQSATRMQIRRVRRRTLVASSFSWGNPSRSRRNAPDRTFPGTSRV